MHVREAGVVVDVEDDGEETDVSGSQSSSYRELFSSLSFSLPFFSSFLEGSNVVEVIDSRGASPGPPWTSNQRHIFQRTRAASRQEEISTTSLTDVQQFR